MDEPLFDGADATKRDLVDYLEAVADRIGPVLSGRPLSVIRVRAGQRPFMQKNVPGYAPPWIKTVSMWAESSHRQVRYALCEDKPTLIWFANQRAVEYHVTLGTAAEGWTHAKAEDALRHTLADVERGIWRPADREPAPAPERTGSLL